MLAKRKVRRRTGRAATHTLPESMHPVIRRVLLARGVSDANALELKLDRLQPPGALSGIDKAAGILADAVCSGERILIVGDFDADGATGTAVAVRGLRSMGAGNVGFRVPDRFDFGYGLSVALVETLAANPPDLLVTVDSGISSVEGVKRSAELGCKVIVTDHHLPGDVLPPADAIVNPNCHGDGFPSKALAGVGVVFYLLSVVRQVLRERGWFNAKRPEPNLANLLDLVALGTVADLVGLDENNRILVRQGIERIRSGHCSAGLLALLRFGKRDYRHLVASDLAFAVAPRLNAAGRLEDMSVGIRCLLTDDREEAMALAAELDTLNHERKARQSVMQREAIGQINDLLASLRGEEPPAAVCLYDPGWHQGIVGLVASRIKDAVYRPVIAFAPETDGSEVLKGSARSVEGLHIRDVLARVDTLHPQMITAFGGHAMAAGLTLAADRLDSFKRAFEGAVAFFMQGESFDNEVLTDGELGAGDISLAFAGQLKALEPWGQHFPEPLFEGRFIIEDQRIVGGAHLKMRLRPLNGHESVDAIAFGCLPEDLPGGGSVGLVYRLDVNHFRGRETCQLVVETILD